MRHVGSVGGGRQSNVVGAGNRPLSQIAVTGPGATRAARAHVRPGDCVDRQAHRRGIVQAVALDPSLRHYRCPQSFPLLLAK